MRPSEARLWRRECGECGIAFDQVGRRGSLRKYCSAECSAAALRHQRTEVRRERYAAARAAGASPATATWASNGTRNFEALLTELNAQKDVQ